MDDTDVVGVVVANYGKEALVEKWGAVDERSSVRVLDLRKHHLQHWTTDEHQDIDDAGGDP